MKKACPGIFLCVILTFAAARTADAEIGKNIPDPSNIILNQPIEVIKLPGGGGTFLKVSGTVSLAFPYDKLDPQLLSTKPSIMVTGLAETGAMLAQAPADPFVEATSELNLPLRDGKDASYLILQYPYSTFMQGAAGIKWVCVQAGRLRECATAPSLNEAKPMPMMAPPESKIELTSCTIFTERSGVAMPLIALTGVVEIVIPQMNAPFPMEIPITVYASNSLGHIIGKESSKAKIFFLRHAMVPNPAYKPGLYNPPNILPFNIVVIPLYMYSGKITLPDDLWQINVMLDLPAYTAKEAMRVLKAMDSNRDGSVDETDDFNGDGLVDHRDWFGMVPAAR